MPNPKQDEPVYYYEWNGSEHELFDANLRVIIDSPNNQHPKVHLTVLRRDETYDNVNNVESVEFQADMTGISYWVKRFGTWPPP